jgi:predicted DNA-binding protein (UPF0251 family)
MKKRSLLLLTYGLAISVALFNCKKDKEVKILEPSEEISKELDAIEVEEVVITAPAPVEVEAGKIEVSTQGTALASGLAGIAASGEIPAAVSAAAEQVEASLSTADIETLNEVTPEVIADVAAGGAVSPQLQAVMDKVNADPVLKAYLPVFTLPKVGGVSVSAARIGSVDEIEAIDLIEVEDVCLQSAEAKFQVKKTELDAAKATEEAKITTAYNTAIAPLAADEAACKASIPGAMNLYRAAIQAQIDKAYADLEAAKSVLGSLYPVLYSLISVQAIGAYSGLPALEAASLAACTATTAAKTAAAQAARNADLAKVTASYNTAIAAATAAKSRLLESCHNQGGGN